MRVSNTMGKTGSGFAYASMTMVHILRTVTNNCVVPYYCNFSYKFCLHCDRCEYYNYLIFHVKSFHTESGSEYLNDDGAVS